MSINPRKTAEQWMEEVLESDSRDWSKLFCNVSVVNRTGHHYDLSIHDAVLEVQLWLYGPDDRAKVGGITLFDLSENLHKGVFDDRIVNLLGTFEAQWGTVYPDTPFPPDLSS